MNNKITLILASSSPRRNELLRQIGFEPVIMPADIEENIEYPDPPGLVCELSKLKCAHVVSQVLGNTGYSAGPTVVLAADTVVVLDGEILGKPENEEAAALMLRSLSGREHHVLTGVTLTAIKEGRVTAESTFYESTEVRFSELTEEEIADYIATGEPMDKAGAYGIQGLFGKHVPSINGNYANVVGLPVSAVYDHLKGMNL